jgi:hypothetical protein
LICGDLQTGGQMGGRPIVSHIGIKAASVAFISLADQVTKRRNPEVRHRAICVRQLQRANGHTEGEKNWQRNGWME